MPSKFISNKRLPGTRAAGRAAVRTAMATRPSLNSSQRDQSQRDAEVDPATIAPPPLLDRLSASSSRKSAALMEEVKRNEVVRLRAEASQLQRELHDVEVRELRAENERLKAENARLREQNAQIMERARHSVEAALRSSAAMWEEASTQLDRDSQPSHRGSAVSSLDDENSHVSLALGCGAGDSLDVRLASSDAASPLHSMPLLRQMAENNRRLKEQLAS